MPPIEERYTDTWKNVQEDCLLCDMEKRTEWYLETTEWLIAEKLGGGPFAVSKKHQKTISDEEWQEMERMIGLAGFEDYELDVRMNLVKDHFHCHILTDETVDLSNE